MKTASTPKMQLVGYESISEEETGFCVGFYSESELSNAHYKAVPTIEGDETSNIARFEEAVPGNSYVPLPKEYSIEVSVGDQWIDILKVSGNVFVGTRSKLRAQVRSVLDELEECFPLTLVDLFRLGESDLRVKYIGSAIENLSAKFDSEVAQSWLLNTYLRAQIMTLVRRKMHAVSVSIDVNEAVRFVEVGASEASQEITIYFNRFDGGSFAQSERNLLDIAKDESFLSIIEELPCGLSDFSVRCVWDDRVQIDQPNEEISDKPLVLFVPLGKSARRRHMRPAVNKFLNMRSLPEDLKDVDIVVAESDDFGALEEPDLRRYCLIVAIIDERDSYEEYSVALKYLEHYAVHLDGGPVLIVPIPPEQRPSGILDQKREFLNFDSASRLVYLDTSFVRSPLWNGPPNFSLSRRVLDQAISVSLILASYEHVLSEVLAIKRKSPSAIITLRDIESGDLFNTRELGYISEASANNMKEHRSLVSVPIDLGRGREGRCELGVAHLSGGRFKDLAIAALKTYLGKEKYEFFIYDDRPLTQFVYGLEDSDGCWVFGVRGRGGPALDLLITSESPTIELLVEGAKNDLQAIRYTDYKSIREFMGLREERGWSGIVPRDIVRSRSQKTLSDEGLFAFIPKQNPSNYSRTEDISIAAEGHRALLGSRVSSDVTRWVFKDLETPIVPKQVDRDTSVLGKHAWVSFRGDRFAAALIASDLFEIWIKGHRPFEAHGWKRSAKFCAIQKFPWPKNFLVDSQRRGVFCTSSSDELDDIMRRFPVYELGRDEPTLLSEASDVNIEPTLRYRLAQAFLPFYGVQNLRSEIEVFEYLRTLSVKQAR